MTPDLADRAEVTIAIGPELCNLITDDDHNAHRTRSVPWAYGVLGPCPRLAARAAQIEASKGR